MDLLDLQAIFNTKFELLEMLVDDSSLFQKGDYVTINDGVVCTIATSIENGSERKECEARFLSEEYRGLYNKFSICRIREIDGDILTIEMFGKPLTQFDDIFFSDGMDIAVEDGVLQYKSVDKFSAEFQENYQVKLGVNRYFIFGKNVFDENTDDFIIVDAGRKKYLRVTKKYFSNLIDDEKDFSDEKVLVICQSERSLCDFGKWIFSFHNVKINIVDKTQKTRLAESAEKFIQSGGDRYVKIWDRYSEAENEMVNQWLQEAGELTFSENEAQKGGAYTFTLEGASNKNKDSFKRYVVDHFDGKVKICTLGGKPFASGEVAENKKIMLDRSIEPRGGKIVPDATGSRKMYERRKMAINAILGGKAKNPCVSMLINGKYAPNAERRKRLPLDQEIIQDIFKGSGANEQQRQAIEDAINTPDIAIIQGPPGTGKTRVIRAILAHLQKYEKKKDKDGSENGAAYLLTAYQREATRNIVGEENDRFGLPIFTYTENVMNGGEDENQRRLEIWCEDCRRKVRDTDQVSENEHRRRLIEKLEDFRTTLKGPQKIHSLEEKFDAICKLLKKLQEENDEVDRNIDKALEIAGELHNAYRLRINCGREDGLLKYIAELPTSLNEMEDGAKSFLYLKAKASQDVQFQAEMKEQLEKLDAIAKKETPTKKDCREIARIKIDMALCYSMRDKTTKEETKEIKNKIGQIIDLLELARLTEKQEILRYYVNDMEPTEELKNSIKRYREIDAVTHQKTMSFQLHSTESLPSYRNVLVDEAARSCPADLLIPIACTQERIILVGDEKQLPHFINEETLNWLKNNLSETDKEIVNAEIKGEETDKSIFSLSMFAYLIDRAEEIKQRDPEFRERIVKLKVQYRMPPVLGDFVSDMFYKGELENGIKDPEAFKQNYPVIGGLNMVWIHVPSNLENQKTNSFKSFFRKTEAEVIINLLKKIEEQVWKEIRTEKKENEQNGRDRTEAKIGIITGYSAQRDLLEKEIGIQAQKDNCFENLKNYIEIGTVDSFQGKQFDIVILSFVRTNGYGFWSIKEKQGPWEIPWAGNHRTCVAFSRAKKCMIVVGDKTLFSGRLAEKAKVEVPAFVEFYNRCEEEKDGVCKVLDKSEVEE